VRLLRVRVRVRRVRLARVGVRVRVRRVRLVRVRVGVRVRRVRLARVGVRVRVRVRARVRARARARARARDRVTARARARVRVRARARPRARPRVRVGRGVHRGRGGGGGGVWLSQFGEEGAEEVAGPVAEEEQHRARRRRQVEQVRERAAVQRAREDQVPGLADVAEPLRHGVRKLLEERHAAQHALLRREARRAAQLGQPKRPEAQRDARRRCRLLHRRRRRRRRRRRLVLRRGLPEPSGGAGLVHHPTTALSPTDRAEDSLKAAEHHGRGSKLAGASAVLAFGEVKAVKGVPAKTRDSLTFSLRALPDCILFVYLVAY
jgi:hypothetical protein